jgi:hypothetical protein
MSSTLPSNAKKYREHSVACNQCDDRPPDLRFGAVTGGGRPIISGMPSAQNHFTINITNQPGAIVDVGKLHAPTSAAPPPTTAASLATALQPLRRPGLKPNDLRRSLLHRTATPSEQQGPDMLCPSPPLTADLPAARSYQISKSARRRNRTIRQTQDKLTASIVSALPAAAAPDQMSDLLLEVASLRKEVHANRKSSPTPTELPRRDPSSPPGPAPEPFEDTRLRLAMEYGYYPVRLGTAADSSMPPARAGPTGADRPFHPLQDSDRLLQRRTRRSCSPPRSPDQPHRRRRLALDSTPTPSVINGFLSPLRRQASGPTRSRSPSRGSRSSSSNRPGRDRRDPKRPRPDSPPRLAPPNQRAWRPCPAPSSRGRGDAPTESTSCPTSGAAPSDSPATSTATDSPRDSVREARAEVVRDSVREALAAVVREKEVQWQGVHATLTGSLLHRFGQSSVPHSSSAEYLSKIEALRGVVADTVAGWRTTRNELAGSILDAFGDDHSPSLSQLDSLTDSLEVALDGPVTRTGSPFTSAGEESSSSPDAAPAGPLAGQPPPVDSTTPARPSAEPAPPPPVASPCSAAPTPLETLLTGTYLSGNEDIEEVHPGSALTPPRASAPARPAGGPSPPSPSPTASTAPPALPPAAAPPQPRARRGRPGRLRLPRQSASSGIRPGGGHYPPLLLVSTAAPHLSALDRTLGRAVQRGRAPPAEFTPSPPRTPSATPHADPAPRVPRPVGLQWPARKP